MIRKANNTKWETKNGLNNQQVSTKLNQQGTPHSILNQSINQTLFIQHIEYTKGNTAGFSDYKMFMKK